MSDWVLESDHQQQVQAPQSDWEVEPAAPSSQQPPSPNESLGMAALKAVPRMADDIYRGIFNTLGHTSDYYNTIKEGIPSAYNTIKNNPGRAVSQSVAGLAELGHNIFNTPHDIANYATNRLNLIPQDINQKIQMARMPDDTGQMINQTFGQPENKGEEFLRGLTRNSESILGGVGATAALNPYKLTNKGIANSVLKEMNNQIETHSNMYNKLWNQAEKQGFNEVPYDRDVLHLAPEILDKFYPQKSVLGLKDFMENPTLEKAQKAQSDMGILRRAIEEKAKTSPLLQTEREIHGHLYDIEKNIEENMFKNKNGESNQKLADRYKEISNSYRENVVPYRYNSDIQAYKNKELTAKELVQRLGKGEFAAKKMGRHPAMGIRQMLAPIATGVGLLGGGAWLYNDIFNNGRPINK